MCISFLKPKSVQKSRASSNLLHSHLHAQSLCPIPTIVKLYHQAGRRKPISDGSGALLRPSALFSLNPTIQPTLFPQPVHSASLTFIACCLCPGPRHASRTLPHKFSQTPLHTMPTPTTPTPSTVHSRAVALAFCRFRIASQQHHHVNVSGPPEMRARRLTTSRTRRGVRNGRSRSGKSAEEFLGIGGG